MSVELAKRSPVDVLVELREAGLIDPNGLDLWAASREFTPEEYVRIGLWLSHQRDWSAFAIGDWLVYGEHAYGDAYYQYAEALGRAPSTLVDYQRVSAYVPRKRRRLDRLSYSHHRAVASLEAKAQVRMLDVAEKEKLTVAQLREQIRAKHGKAADQGTETEEPPSRNGVSPGIVVEELVEASRSVWSRAQEYGDGSYLVPREPMMRLRGALGEER